MALSETERIWNLALGQIGDYEVTEGQTNTNEYLICSKFDENARKRTLKAHPWNESTKRVIIPQETYGPIFEFNNKFALPTDHLKILSISPDGFDELLWEVEGDYIKTNEAFTPQTWVDDSIKYAAGEYVTLDSITYLCVVSNVSETANSPDLATGEWTSTGGDLAVLYVRYVWNNTDISTYSEDLKNAYAQQLAILIAPRLQNDIKTKNNLIQELEQITMPKARSVDAQEGKPRRYYRSSWLRSRGGSYGRRSYGGRK
jgi:hypothetical protein